MTELLEQVAEIKRRRAVDAAWSVFTSIGTFEVLFAAFAFGASFGPGPLRPIELVLGLAASFTLGAVAAVPFARRRIEKRATLRLTLDEGRRRRRIVVFGDYLTVGREIVPKGAITEVEVDARGLVLRYRDPVLEGAVLRELSGARTALERLFAAIAPES